MFRPRVAAASLSGAADAAWARDAAPHVGAAVIGGIAIDDASRAAARVMVADRDRDEFLPADPIAFIDLELARLADVDLLAGVNVRSATRGPLRAAARVCGDRGAVIEVNAHCRQRELCAVGCGETLLGDPARLADHVAAAAGTGATVSVKLRAEVPGVDLVAVARRVTAAGAAVLHVDAMDTEPVIRDIAAAVGDDAFLIANNGVRDAATAEEYLDYGADAVSVGRPSTDPRVLARVHRGVEDWFATRGMPS